MCQAVVSLPEALGRSRPVLEFFHPLASDVQKPPEAVLPVKKSVPASALAISGPSKLVRYRCSDDFVSSDKLEMSLKRDTIVQVLQKHGNGLCSTIDRNANQYSSDLLQAGGTCNMKINVALFPVLS